MSVDQRLLTIDRDLSEGERLLRDTAAAFVDRARRSGGLRAAHRGEDGGAARSMAREAARLGWSGILVPAEHGGAGATLREAAVVFEQLGHGPVWGSLLTSGAVAAQLVAELGGEEQRAQLLPSICSGELSVAPAILDAPRWAARSIRMQARREADGSLRLSGARRFVLGAGDADTLLCAVRADGDDDVALALVDARQRGVSVQRVDGLLHDVWDVHLDGVRVAADDMLGSRTCAWAELENALAPAILLLAAYTVGACDELFTETVAYTRVRRVFGQTIGRFQRVQDHCVELSLRTDAVRLVTDEAIEGWMQGNRDLVPVHEARSVAAESYYHGCNDAHMVHAGPGTALDHPLMPHTVMSRTLFAYLGDPASHRRAMVDRLLARDVAVAS